MLSEISLRQLQTNIERHLHSKQISSATTRLFIQDIFGWTDIEGIHREGLVDCKDADEFYDLLSDLKDTWLQRESCSSSSKTFYEKYKAEVFCTSTLQPLREAAGLGKPPIGYFTNPNESINSALKKKNYKKQELPVFINLMRVFVTQQQEEVEKAVIGGGKYNLDTPYKGYEVIDGSWFRPMTESQKAYLKKFNSNYAATTMSKEIVKHIIHLLTHFVLRYLLQCNTCNFQSLLRLVFG